MSSQNLNNIYQCPVTHNDLEFVGTFDSKGKPEKGYYKTTSSTEKYLVENGLPDFCYPNKQSLPKSDKSSLDWYKNNAAIYDENLPLTFNTFNTDEIKEREYLVNLLDLKGNETILEFGCGTCRDSELIAKRLKKSAKLYLQDISPEILKIGINKLKKLKLDPKIEFSIANAYYLPFPDNFFDRVFHFGGLNTFGDLKRTFNEIIRVSKKGAKVVIGDENMPTWLRNTDFGKVLMNSNPHYKYNLPLEYLPIEARNVKLEWIIGGVFYVITFDVGEGMPHADIDFQIPGVRGGSHRTRYYGHLEGVSKEACDLAVEARKFKNISMYDWLDNVIKEAAKRDLEDV